jgi:vancomycin resistance protein VanJ
VNSSRVRHGALLTLKLATIGVSLLYVAGLFAWFALYELSGDAPPTLYAVNALALYFFLPLPLLVPLAFALRRREIAAGFIAGAALWLYLWGGLFWPPVSPTSAGGDSLTFMTFNALGFSLKPASAVETVRASNADIVALQELNPEFASAIAGELREEYPYQYLDPRPGVRGMGVISRIPMTPLDSPVPDPDWVGTPQLVAVEHDGKDVLVLNVHAAAKQANTAERKQQSKALASWLDQQERPVVLLGDFNATPMNESIEILTGLLGDAWQEAGSGFGHTFPGASAEESPGSSRPAYLGVTVPRWLVRIDYIVHSEQWKTISARNGRSDGTSDHRPVIATMVLKDQE